MFIGTHSDIARSLYKVLGVPAEVVLAYKILSIINEGMTTTFYPRFAFYRNKHKELMHFIGISMNI